VARTGHSRTANPVVDDAVIQHYGVKGMKWGVIRDKVASAGRAGGKVVKTAYQPSQDAKKSHVYMARAKLGGVQNLNNHEMRLVINRMKLEREYKELYGERQWHNAGKKWAGQFVNDVLRDVTVSWLRNPFANGGGNTGPLRAESWTTGQNFASAIESPRRAIGS